MSTKQDALVARAFEKHGVIYPCGTRTSLDGCFTRLKGRLVFWYNTPDGSTHVEVLQD